MTDDFAQRLADLRRRRGLTQVDLSRAAGITSSFLSLLEKGSRRPSPKRMRALADALGVTVDYLTLGRGGDLRTVELDLRFAEVALWKGDPATARERFAAAHRQAVLLGDAYVAEQHEALYGLARADEALGRLGDAIPAFEALLAARDLPSSVNRGKVRVWLCRAYTHAGDLGRAIELGEAALGDAGPLNGHTMSDDLVELAATLVEAYHQRGDLTRAQMLIDTVVVAAEASGSMRARGAAYWNAAVIAEERGDMRAAVRDAERALALYRELGHAFAVAALRGNAACYAIRLPGADFAAAEAQLRESIAELHNTIASPADVAAMERELARCYLLDGRVDDAVATARQALERIADGGVPLERARVQAVLAAALHAHGDDDEAMTVYLDAATALEAVDAGRQAAPVWRDLAAVVKKMGRHEETIAALERVAAVLGVRASPIEPATAA